MCAVQRQPCVGRAHPACVMHACTRLVRGRVRLNTAGIAGFVCRGVPAKVVYQNRPARHYYHSLQPARRHQSIVAAVLLPELFSLSPEQQEVMMQAIADGKVRRRHVLGWVLSFYSHACRQCRMPLPELSLTR